MRKVFIFIICAVTLCSLATAEETGAAKAKVDLDGKVYIGYMPVDEESGLPDPDGAIMAPVYVAVSQYEDRFCCSLVTIDVDDDRPGLPDISLASFYGAEGTVTNKNFEFTLELDTGALKLSVPVKGTVLGNGNLDCELFQPLGPSVPMTFVPVNTTAKKYSGIYIGKVWIKGEAQPKVNNLAVAFVANGNKITGTTIFYPPDEPEGVFLDTVAGTLNQNTGAFSYVGEPPYNTSATGTIKNGVFEIDAEAGNQEYLAKAYLMADTSWVNPNIGKKPKPKKLPAGKRTAVTIAQTKCMAGGAPHIADIKIKSSSVPSAKDPVIYLERYSLTAKALELVFVVADDAKGTFKLEFINPSGKSGLSKKFKFK